MTNRKVIQKVGAKKRSHGPHSTHKRAQKSPSVVFVGAGNLGGAVIKSLVSAKVYGKKDILVITATEASAKRWRKWGVAAQSGDYSPLAQAKEIWLAIKPYQIKDLAPQLKSQMSSKAMVISLLAGWAPSSLQKLLGSSNLVTVMTNTAARVDAGLYAVFYAERMLPAWQKSLAARFQKLGHFCGCFGEEKMPQITALIGSSPAFFLHLQRQFVNYAVENGIAVSAATRWFEALFRANQKLSADTKDLAALIAQIATPGGCTEKGLQVLDATMSLNAALVQCAAKAKEMGS